MNKHWKPVSYPQLVSLLVHERQQLDDSQTALWDVIRLPSPELWQQHPWGDEGCGFWVVAVCGRHCIYYNDINQGFGFSVFPRWAMIQDFNEHGQPLKKVLKQLNETAMEPESLCS